MRRLLRFRLRALLALMVLVAACLGWWSHRHQREQLLLHRRSSAIEDVTLKLLRVTTTEERALEGETMILAGKRTGKYEIETYRMLLGGKEVWSKQIVNFLDLTVGNGHERFAPYDIAASGRSVAILYVHEHEVHMEIVQLRPDGGAERPTTVHFPIRWSSLTQIPAGRLLADRDGFAALIQLEKSHDLTQLWEVRSGKALMVWESKPVVFEEVKKTEDSTRKNRDHNSPDGK